ncbi:hypothetical protein Tco_0169504 [Tanacetum coccineum]
MQVFVGQCASRGGGRSGRGDGNDGSGSGSGVNDATGSGVNAGSASGGRGGGRAGGSGGRGGGRVVDRSKRGCGRDWKGSVIGGCYFQAQVVVEYQLELDEQAFRECMEEQAKLDKERKEERTGEYEKKRMITFILQMAEESIEECHLWNQQYH